MIAICPNLGLVLSMRTNINYSKTFFSRSSKDTNKKWLLAKVLKALIIENYQDVHINTHVIS